MRTWQPRRDRAGNNAEKPRPDQPSSQDATRTTVHDRRKPSRAEPDARCRQPFAAQAFAAGAPARVCSCRRTQEDQTMARRKPRPCQKDKCPKLRTKPTASHTQARKRSTRKLPHKLFAANAVEHPVTHMRHSLEEQYTMYSTWTNSKTLCSDRELLLLCQEEHPSAAQCAEEHKSKANSRDKAPRGVQQSQQASQPPGLRGGGSQSIRAPATRWPTWTRLTLLTVATKQ